MEAEKEDKYLSTDINSHARLVLFLIAMAMVQEQDPGPVSSAGSSVELHEICFKQGQPRCLNRLREHAAGRADGQAIQAHLHRHVLSPAKTMCDIHHPCAHFRQKMGLWMLVVGLEKLHLPQKI